MQYNRLDNADSYCNLDDELLKQRKNNIGVVNVVVHQNRRCFLLLKRLRGSLVQLEGGGFGSLASPRSK